MNSITYTTHRKIQKESGMLLNRNNESHTQANNTTATTYLGNETQTFANITIFHTKITNHRTRKRLPPKGNYLWNRHQCWWTTIKENLPRTKTAYLWTRVLLSLAALSQWAVFAFAATPLVTRYCTNKSNFNLQSLQMIIIYFHSFCPRKKVPHQYFLQFAISM